MAIYITEKRYIDRCQKQSPVEPEITIPLYQISSPIRPHRVDVLCGLVGL